MKARILHIGIVDKRNRVHAVSFNEGVNVVTGRSSTGKSALIEIFDFCFGSSEFTVPMGVITERAHLYFTAMKVGSVAIVLARQANSSRAFIKEERDLERVREAQFLSTEYFEKEFFLPHDAFLKEVKRFFGLDITDLDEDLEARRRRRFEQKLPTPSVRSFTSFMLQHQNLVANKHAIFYRFEEREKREQAIDHLKIFLGFVDQEYFVKQQQLNELERQIRTLERLLPKRQDVIQATQKELKATLSEYEAIAGTPLGIDIDSACRNPRAALQIVATKRVELVADSDGHVRRRQQIEFARSEATQRLRQKQIELSNVISSIDFAQRYAYSNRNTLVPTRAELQADECPFCHSQSHVVEESANALSDAIHWLNTELAQSSYRLESFEGERSRIERELAAIRSEVAEHSAQLKMADDQLAKLGRQKGQYELSVEVKVRVEQALKNLAKAIGHDADSELTSLRIREQQLREEIKGNFDIRSKLEQAESRIREILAILGDRFEFEDSYQPIRLRFSLDTFDLWHETPDRKKVFLRSMGSGANWLSCHLTLFLALHRYFCELGDECHIPPILFLDQPSQVYFPSILDGGESFSPVEIAKKDMSRSAERPVDDDVRAVTNLFDALVSYCQETYEATNIMPQIIVTDHADHLKLSGGSTFESLIRARWRGRNEGFIAIES
ncbi:Skp family chaperone for outer membrane proteins [Paraburkholderia sp. GAS33]|uniref:DUF3732 domain-containing protein n=1 Tax=Paraburkholderia sp. GAS33 TaxID=3035130 RepID=UPI003D1E7253